MKKLLLMMSVLLSLGMFCACSSDDEMSEIGNKTSDAIIELTPIEEGEDYVAISEFFKTEFGGSYDDDKPFDFKNNLSDEENPCVVINNEEDFKEAYTGYMSLPVIDFSKYTLIIGKIYESGGTFIDNVYIKTNNAKTTLFVDCIMDTKGFYLGGFFWCYYWKLFPKFHASKINVEISKEKGIVDDSKKQ